MRVFNTTSGTAVYDLRRGTFGATVHSLAFDIPAERLVLTSAETVHVFDLSYGRRLCSPAHQPASAHHGLLCWFFFPFLPPPPFPCFHRCA